MGMQDDNEAMQRHWEAGTLKEFMEGTAPQLPPERMPVDRSATMRQGYAWMRARGE